MVIVLLVALSFGSCSKFLDVSDELAEELDYEKVFSEPVNVRRFHRLIYTGIPNTAAIAREPDYTNGYGNPWPQLADEIERAQGADFNLIAFNSSHSVYGRWNLYYQLIRQANVFLERAKVIPQQGDADYLSEEELFELTAQARFFRAYYHYLLFELYGPIPVMDYVADPNDANQDYARNSVDEVVKFVNDEMSYCAEALKDPNLANQDQLGVPTRGMALAVRARLMVYAASPLFNGGFAEALEVRNTDGKALFPAKDDTKWAKALEAAQAFIDYANAGHYELFTVLNSDGTINPDESLYQMFMGMNKEVIFARTNGTFGGISSPRAGIDGWNVPRGVRGGTATTGYLAVTQELVDDFFMADGLDIGESPLYNETGFSVAGEDPSGRTEPGTYRMWINREPRFYRTVFYNQRKWHVGNEVVTFHRGGNSSNAETSDYPKTGYIMYKRMSRRVYDQGSNPKSEYRPAFVHRLAEFYLLYAEALNEVSPGDSRVLEYVDRVRERAGIPKLADIKPNIKGDQAAQREAIRREMRVELATEGQRYFDVRRWMLAETDGYRQGGPIHGMNMNGNEADFYQRTLVENRVFNRAMYLYPIPLAQIQNSNLLVQNPLY